MNLTESLPCAAVHPFLVVTTVRHLGETSWVFCTNYEAEPHLRMRDSFGNSSELPFGFYALYTKDKQRPVAKRLLFRQP